MDCLKKTEILQYIDKNFRIFNEHEMPDAFFVYLFYPNWISRHFDKAVCETFYQTFLFIGGIIQRHTESFNSRQSGNGNSEIVMENVISGRPIISNGLGRFFFYD